MFGIFVSAFNELSRERKPSEKTQKQVSVYRIAYRDIREWAERNGYAGDSEFMDELPVYVQALDTVWVELEVKRLKAGKPDG